MKHLFLLLSSLSLVYAAAHAEQDKFSPLPSYKVSTQIDVMGLLVWTSEKQTITCMRYRYGLLGQVLAANPYFQLSSDVEKLLSNDAENTIAELRGSVATDLSSKPKYNIDEALYVSEIISVAKGSCDDEYDKARIIFNKQQCRIYARCVECFS